MNYMKNIVLTTILAIALMVTPSAFAVNLTVGNGTGAIGETIDIDISVDDPVGIAGAAFTITYDTSVLSVDVDSVFFDTFVNQFAGTSAPTEVVVDGMTYTQPLLANDVSGTGTRVAAARAIAADASNTTLFTLHVVGDASGVYPITIAQTVLDNTAAGYDAAGEAIPYLVGADATQTDLSLAFPIIDVASITVGNVTVEDPGTSCSADSDDDGICDDWENTHFGDLSTANATSDYDKDGYRDKQEFLNGSPYDPKVKDDPDGPGYDPATDSTYRALYCNFRYPVQYGGIWCCLCG